MTNFGLKSSAVSELTKVSAAHQDVLAEMDELEEAWLEAYRVRIPVLQDSAGRELGWPFTLGELQGWLAQG